MSHQVNEQILEDAREAFYIALDAKDWEQCEKIKESLREMGVIVLSLERELATAKDDAEANGEPDDFSNSKIEDYGL